MGHFFYKKELRNPLLTVYLMACSKRVIIDSKEDPITFSCQRTLARHDEVCHDSLSWNLTFLQCDNSFSQCDGYVRGYYLLKAVEGSRWCNKRTVFKAWRGFVWLLIWHLSYDVTRLLLPVKAVLGNCIASFSSLALFNSILVCNRGYSKLINKQDAR